MIVACEKCQTKQRVSNREAGRKVSCLSCGHVFEVDGGGLPGTSGRRRTGAKKQKRSSSPKNSRAKSSRQVPWSVIVASSFDSELLRATLKAAGPVLLFAIVFCVVVVPGGLLLAVFSPPMGVPLLWVILIAGPLWLQGYMLRWHLGVIHRYAGNTHRIDSYDLSSLQSVLFLFVTAFIALILFFPTVIFPMKLFFAGVLSASPNAAWGFAWAIGLTFIFVYFQMACAVYALEGDQNPGVVMVWLWKSLPGLLGYYFLSAVFVITFWILFQIYMALFTMATANTAKSLGALDITARVIGAILAVVLAVMMYCYLYLAPFAMFGKFLKRYRQNLGYEIR